MIRKFLPYFYTVLTIDLIVSPIATFFSAILSKSFLVKEITLSGVLVEDFICWGYLPEL